MGEREMETSQRINIKHLSRLTAAPVTTAGSIVP